MKINLYTILPIGIGCSMEDITKAYDKYKKLNLNENIKFSQQILEILDSEYNRLKEIGLEKYNESINKPVPNNRKRASDDSLKKLINVLNDDVSADVKHEVYKKNGSVTDEDLEDYEERFGFKKENIKYKNEEALKKLKSRKINFIKKVIAGILAVTAVASGAALAFKGCSNDQVNDVPTYVDDATEKKSYTFSYIVKDGDTLTEIYEKFGIYYAGLNNAKGILYPGEVLVLTTEDEELALRQQAIYEAQIAKPVLVEWEEYVVKPGDTVPEIAEKYGVTPQDLVDWNEYSVPDVHTVYAGYKIKVPTKVLYGQDAIDYRNQIKESGRSVG